ncbi:uncharacterized protein LOC123566560 [Mercenaria mercenaria]|uniref:uncharacterized protein LOC123566560 n=1 Tax=Mercenaria mercenaria TaxID=6596 RepID=UPI00234E7208|nr:uncharacterized protein LOC123566560 [Mercenaria mercenaria]
MSASNMNILCVIFLFVAFTSANHFRGGTISWKPIGKQNEVEFTFKLGWALTRGPGCDETMVGKYVNNLPRSDAWYCSRGCGPTKVWLSDVNYICTAASKAQNWEQGEKSFKYTFPNEGPFTVEFTGGAWIALDFGTGGNWNISTVVDLRVRNDTGRSNTSPFAAAKPIYSMKFGCTNTIQLPVNDQDGDKVTCRWSVDQECASVCNALPYAMIDPDTCSLTVSAKHTRFGWYAVAITIEDRARQTISLNNDSVIMEDDVISSVPMQFLINTPAIPSRSCSDKPVFVSPTPPESQIFILTPGKTLTTSFYATSKGASITSFELTAPPGVRKSSIQTVPGRPGVYKFTVTWTPRQQNKGQRALCAEATDSFVISSDSHCLTVVAWDIDPCKSTPCQHGGNCTRTGYTDNFVCTCVPGYTDALCQTDINECASDPCQNNATCFDLINEFFCGCVTGFTGEQCETDINECASMKCLNGGTCEDLIGEGVCHCLPSFTGTLCQTGLDYCASLPCLNNGGCYSNTSGYICSCVDGWHGINCAYRDEEMNYTGTMLMMYEHMHYSSCSCLFGNERRQICYPYNKAKGVGFGTLGTALGVATSVLLYILFEGVFGKGLACFHKIRQLTPARPKLNTSAIPDVFKRNYGTYGTAMETDNYESDEKACGQVAHSFLSRGTYHNRKCWACRTKEEKANKPVTTHEFLRKYSGLKNIPEGCTTTISVPLQDVDDDVIKCRWASNGECGDMCDNVTNTLPSGTLNQPCSLTVDAKTANGYSAGSYYLVALTIEDFPAGPISLDGVTVPLNRPLSSVPLQFLIYVENATTSCTSNPVFIDTPADGSEYIVTNSSTWSQRVYVQGKSGQKPSAMTLSGPRGMSVTAFQPDDLGRSSVMYVDMSWTPTSGMNGINIACFQAVDDTGNPSQQRCFVLLTGYPDPCASNPCKNGGQCDIEFTNFTCTCPTGVYGNFCQYDVDECVQTPCENGGQCFNTVGDYKCFCRPGFAGKNCSDSDYCSSNPCQGRGDCVHNVTSFSCDCYLGYSGSSCQIDEDNCTSNPCQNGAECTDLVGGYYCECPPQYTGQQCEQEIDFCDPSPCQNGGICRRQKNDYVCDCPDDVIGLNCEISIEQMCNGDQSYCTCHVNGEPVRVPIPDPVDDETYERDLRAGVIGYPVGLLIGVGCCALFHYVLRPRCRQDGGRKDRKLSSTASTASFLSSSRSTVYPTVASPPPSYSSLDCRRESNI